MSEAFGHSDKRNIIWLGSMLQKEGQFARGMVFDNEVLFGEHLLPKYPDRQVALVESPKNAVLGACAYPQLLWVATGNKGMLKRSVLEPLRGRDVMVFPDNDAIEEWSQKLAGMSDLANFCVVKEKMGTGEKDDVGDEIIAREMRRENS